LYAAAIRWSSFRKAGVPQGWFQNFSGWLALPEPPLLPLLLQAASAATVAALTPAPSSVRRVKPDPVGRDAIFGVLSDAGFFVRCVDVPR
jgi:hypothetical protein